MWKTPGRFWAQIGPFAHILQSKTDDIHCGAMDLALFRKPYLSPLSLMVYFDDGNRNLLANDEARMQRPWEYYDYFLQPDVHPIQCHSADGGQSAGPPKSH
jgi:hypothetical protein